MKTQFLDGIGSVNDYISSGASAISSIANLVSAAKGTGVQNLTQQPTTTTKTVVQSSNNNANSTALLQQQLLLQQAAKSNTGLSTNAKIGIAVGGVAVLGLIIAVIATKK